MTNPADPVLMAVADGLETTAKDLETAHDRARRYSSDDLLGRLARDHDTLMAALLSERHRAEEAKWLPMDSAPKDGTRVLVAWKAFAGISDHVELGKWKQRDGWCNTYGKSFRGIPDYFMPLPALPLTPEPTHER